MQSKKTKLLSGCFLVLFVAFAVLALVIGGIFYWYQSNLTPTASGQEKTIVVTKGDSFLQVAQKLENQGIIKNALAFRIYLKINNKNPNIQAGSFKIKTGLKPDQVVQSLSVGRVDKWITIPEGLRKEEIASKLAKEFTTIKEEDFLKSSQEGFMFPDTYLIPVDASGEKAASIMRVNFDNRLLSLNSSIASSGRSLEQTITLASIVERESRASSERPIIAGILIKRLNQGMALEVDATTQYALGYQENQASWWKKNLTSDDLAISSPYNTRKNTGLPPGPICNPGLDSIKAVVSPQSTDYYYYLHDKEGKVHFAKTLDEHNANVAKYL